MRHKAHRYYAYVIDDILDHYRKTRKTERMPGDRLLLPILELMFPKIKRLGRGYFKKVFLVESRRGRKLVLKIGRPEAIDMDLEIYRRAMEGGLAGRYFSGYHWRTKYCILQDYGRRRKVPRQAMDELRRRAYAAGLVDIKGDNVRLINGRFRIIDANLRGGRPRMRSLSKYRRATAMAR